MSLNKEEILAIREVAPEGIYHLPIIKLYPYGIKNKTTSWCGNLLINGTRCKSRLFFIDIPAAHWCCSCYRKYINHFAIDRTEQIYLVDPVSFLDVFDYPKQEFYYIV